MAGTARSQRLRRSDCAGEGIIRRRYGRGFAYVDADGERVEDAETLARIGELAIPPAWKDVWICPDPLGHIQATGTDAAGRKQYLYHARWRERRDQQKFEKMVRFGEGLPKLRRRVRKDLGSSSDPGRQRGLACAVRLLDVGRVRVGSEGH